MANGKIILVAFGVLILVCGYIFLSSFGTSNNQPNVKPQDNGITVTPEPSAVPAATPAFGPEPEPIVVNGANSDLIKIHLEQGLAIFTVNHLYNGKCEIWLSDEIGKIERIVSTDKGYWGSKAISITEESDYYLESHSEDRWTVQVTQPRVYYAQGVPVSLNGSARRVSDFFTLDAGQATFKMSHGGWLDFEIWLFKNDGTKLERLASAHGPYDDSVTINITNSGVYLLDIQADGRWTVDIRQ